MGFEALSVVQVGMAGLLAVGAAGMAGSPMVVWRPDVIYAILITGVLATALAFTVQAWAQQFTTSTRTGLVYMLEPVFAWMTSFLFLSEGLTARAAAGAFLILGGVILVEVKPLNPRSNPLR